MKFQKVISVEDALGIACTAPKEFGARLSESSILEAILLSCPTTVVDGVEVINRDHLHTFLENFIKSIQKNDPSFLLMRRGYKGPLVDIEEFLESPQYMNQKAALRPVVKYELLRLFEKDNYFVEAALSGPIGMGKSFFCELAIDYMLYKQSMLFNPQLEYDLAIGSSIIFVIQSVSLQVAKKAVFEGMTARLRSSPYFSKHFPFDQKVKSELRFPNNVFITPVSSSELSVIGQNVYGGHMTEVAYMDKTENSKRGTRSNNFVYDKADVNYVTISQRMKSRFQSLGKTPGILLLDSASNYPGDFMDRKLKEAKKDPTIFTFAKRYAAWDILSRDKFCGDKFLVEIGDATHATRIIASRDMADNSDRILEVPVEYLKDFKRNAELALRDYANISSAVESNFFSRKDLIERAVAYHEELFGGIQLFTQDSVVIDDFLNPSAPDYDSLVNFEYIKSPSFDNTASIVMHMDLAVNTDPAGIAVSRVFDYIESPASTYYSDRLGTFIELTNFQVPRYCTDGILQILPPYGGEIHLDLVRNFGFYLCRLLGMKFVTFDVKGEGMFIQGFRRLKARSGRVSTRVTTVPYHEWRSCYLEERIIHPRHRIYTEEISTLVYDPKKDKVDHSPGYHNDTTDAVASTVHILQHKVARYNRTKLMEEATSSAEQASVSRHQRTLTVGSKTQSRIRVS